MKKLIVSVLVVFITASLFAQKSAGSANHNTAMRCLKLAENCLVAGDWDNALRQAELGLAYDDSISDLIYIKATALSNLEKTRAEVIPVIAEAFEKNSWTGYAKNGARILYADLLCDTGNYEKSLELLNQEPFIFTADAEYIRIKNFYRMGTAQSLENARLKVNSSRRVYPQDSRFPNIFFMFESLIKTTAELKGVEYVIPETVQLIADSYISKLPDYTTNKEDLEIYASFLAGEEVRTRLIKAISAKNVKNKPLLVIAQKQINMISDQKAFNDFFESIGNSVSLHNLDLFISSITDEEVKQQIIEKFTNWDGTIYIDENLDLQNEMAVKYNLGRPQYINYDANNDGTKELYTTCDFGAPVSIYFINDKVELFYDSFPKVQKVNFVEDNYTFNFLHDDYSYTPFDMDVDKVMQTVGFDFYVPSVKGEFTVPTPYDLTIKASTVELPIAERDGAVIQYTVLNGELVFAKFFEGDNNYAYCDFTTGSPFYRYVDYDNDGMYETTEVYATLEEGYVLLEEEKELINKIFSKVASGKNVYLKKVQIDRNSNTNFEFTEEYLSAGGRITTWDNDDNGIIDCQFIRYPAKEDSSVIEESVFYGSNGLPVVSLYTLDEIPLKMNYGEEEVMIYSGESPDLYWVEEKQSKDIEDEILEYVKKGITQGVIELFTYKEQRYSIIRIGNDYFCKKIELLNN